ncbi:MAG: tol-pal system protein YbgF [Nitrospirota bacterium]|nr:tol-pal system protein YbgF [Nitrospirota bacterium]
MHMNLTPYGKAALCAAVLAGSGLVLSGCAAHADFVKTQEQIRAVAKQQEQDRQRDEETQKRLQALEAKGSKAPAADQAVKGLPKDVDALRRQMEELTDRLNDVDRRVARLQDSQYAAPPPAPSKSDTAPGPPSGEPSRQSRPAKLPEPPAVLPGTPDISPTSAFNLAQNDYLNGRYELAIRGFERFLKDFPSTSKTPDAHYFIGESYYSLRDYPHAMQAFDLVVQDYPKSEKVPAALFKLGLSSAETGDPLKARSYLKRVLEEFASSNEAKLAKNKLAELR